MYATPISYLLRIAEPANARRSRRRRRVDDRVQACQRLSSGDATSTNADTSWGIGLVLDALQLPFYDDFAEIYGKFAMFEGGVGVEAESLHGRNHVRDEVMPHRIIDLSMGGRRKSF